MEPPSFPPGCDVAARALAEAVAGEPAVIAAWLFGSIARGTAGPLSDVDIALALGNSTGRDEVGDRVFATLARRLRTDRVDLVLFDEASLALRARIIRDGRLVVCRDRRRYERLATDVVMQDLDFQPIREAANRAARDAILGRR